jgi:adenosylcobinamide-GDP ribazoletransferase
MSTQWRLFPAAPRFMPLIGALIGAVGGGVYWIGAQIWPTSIAVVLSMFATALLSAGAGAGAGARAPASGMLGFVFALLVKYNALMALSAANLPFPLPANIALGLIMIAGHAASRALVVSVLASPTHPASKPASHGDLAMALAIGFAPAALIGLSGLIGLVAAIMARIVFIAYVRRSRPPVAAAELDITQELTEVCFYLGALATWAYI